MPPARQAPLFPATPLQTLLNTMRRMARSETDKGAAFEALCIRYLQHEPAYAALYRTVEHYKDWAARHGLPKTDNGIDLVATTRSGECHAVQCKCYAPDHIVAKADIDSFVTASDDKVFAARILIDTTLKAWGRNAEKVLQNPRIPLMRIDLHKLENSQIDWSQYTIHQPAAPLFDGAAARSGEIALKPRHALLAHQQEAIHDVLQGLQAADRGKLIMACGSGKTFTALQIAQALAGKGQSVLFLVPSLALLSQTLTEWHQQSSVPLTAFAVCSDSEVGKRKEKDADDDTIHMALHELAYPATTDAAKLAKEHAARHTPDAMSVVFSTYHSIDVIQQAQQQGLAAFALAICDEAHRTTGQTLEGEAESAFVRIHDPAFIQAHKRLYMTATPRIYGDNPRQKTPTTLYSMDDEAHYGRELHHLGFAQAVQKGLLVPYQVVVLAVDAQQVRQYLGSRMQRGGGETFRADDAVRIVGCFKALAKVGQNWPQEEYHTPMQRAVAFCQIIGQDRQGRAIDPGKKIAARHIAEMFQHVTNAYKDNPASDERVIGYEFDADFIHGGMGAKEKSEKLQWLKAPLERNQCRLLTNVRCLSEGVDLPALDAVIFLSPRQSQVEVVQSVGRVMRKAAGKKRGYIILPVIINSAAAATPEDILPETRQWKTVWQTLAALKAHDTEGLGQMIDRADLRGSDPERLLVICDTAPVRRAPQLSAQERAQAGALRAARASTHIGEDIGEEAAAAAGASSHGNAAPPASSTGEIEQLVTTLIIKKMRDPSYWSRWSGRIAEIAAAHTAYLEEVLRDARNTHEHAAFAHFTRQLHEHVNPALQREDIIQMLAQHRISAPVLDAILGNSDFTRKNPLSQALHRVNDILFRQQPIDDLRQQGLRAFYQQVQHQASGIAEPAARQKLLVRLYDDFFADNFPRLMQKHGIVYTPVEVVDFILHSVAHVLQAQFGKNLADDDVQILDPFTGTGTFIARLLASGLIADEHLPRVYANQLHATEILLLPYYIAAVNIESTLAQRLPGLPYTPFPGVLLGDTFNISTGAFEKGIEKTQKDFENNQQQAALADNNARRRRQMDSKITIIVGNPPYSVGQKSANDNNQNMAYPELDKRIAATYAKKSGAICKKSLYDSYIRAIRWASDRIAKETGGIIGFVTNAGWLDSVATAGLRQCLCEEFSSLYVFHLRGNCLTQGEIRRKEGGNIFDQGSRTPVAISILVKNLQHTGEKGSIHFFDIGDYLSREQKLAKIVALKNVGHMEHADSWKKIKPDAHGDWLQQRQGDFSALLPMGDAKNKNKPGNRGMFVNYSNGVKTQRDAWCNNPSRVALLDNVRRMVNFYEMQRAAFNRIFPGGKQRQEYLAGFIDADPEKISWTHALKADLARNRALAFNPHAAVPTLYRPFSKAWLYYDRRLNERVYQMPQIFPLPAGQSRAEQSRAEQSHYITCRNHGNYFRTHRKTRQQTQRKTA